MTKANTTCLPEEPCDCQVKDWRWLLSNGLNSAAECVEEFGGSATELAKVEKTMPIRVNAYYRSLITSPDGPIGRQVLPSVQELSDPVGVEDPLHENPDSPVPHLVHRYPDRVLFLATYQCAVYCRFCTRKRVVGRLPAPTDEELLRAVAYVRGNPTIRDVIVSGGDPLTLADERLGRILGWLRAIKHVEILRVDTRIPCSLPQRVTESLCRELAKCHPLYVNTHFNHPQEVTPQAKLACERLADHGIPVGNQAVLLRGINDNPAIMKELMLKLLSIRVRPYYLYQCDPVSGTEHFRTKIDAGLEILAALRGHTSGLAIPSFVIDAPGGGGKVALLPDRVVEMDDQQAVVRNHEGRTFTYKQVDSQPKE